MKEKPEAEVTNPLYGKFDEVAKAMFPPVLPKQDSKPKPQKQRRVGTVRRALRRHLAP